jgi:hypothetical protein
MLPAALKNAETRIKAALKEKTEVAFTDTTLTDAVAYLGELHGQIILFDVRAMNDAGIDLSATVNLEISGKSLDETLKTILAKVKAKHVVDHEVILIQPAAKGKAKR